MSEVPFAAEICLANRSNQDIRPPDRPPLAATSRARKPKLPGKMHLTRAILREKLGLISKIPCLEREPQSLFATLFGGSSLSGQLTDAFLRAFELQVTQDKAAIYTVENTGNWKALSPLLHERLGADIDAAARYPVMFGGETPLYLKQTGAAGARQFRDAAKNLLEKHERVFVFDAQKIDCLRSHPDALGDALLPGRLISFFYRGPVDEAFRVFLTNRTDLSHVDATQVGDQSISVISTQLSEQILIESYKLVSAELTATEIKALNEIRAEVFETIVPEIEDNLLGFSFGVPKLREFARRKIIAAVLKATTPTYSIKSGIDPIEFFRQELADRFKRYELPTGYLSEVSPYLSFVVKSQHKYAELKY